MYKKRLLSLCITMAASGSLYAQEPAQQQNPKADDGIVEEVTVTGVRNAELNAREDERNKNVFSSVISQDDAGNFTDQNVAESLQRLPGITLEKSEGEGKFVSVRGLGPSFVSVSMNGAEMASAGADDRSVSLDVLPADMLGGIEVFKSLTPDMDLNSIGGAVNVKTVNAFDKKKDTLKASIQNYVQGYSEKSSPKVAIQGTNLFADDTIGVSYTLSWENRVTEMYQVVHHQTTDLREYTADFSGSTPGDTVLGPYQFYANQENADRTRKTGSLDLGWRPTDASEYHLRYSRTDYEDKDLARREYYRFDEAGTGDVVFADAATGTFGVVDASLQQQLFVQDGTSSSQNYDLSGENKFGEDQNWKLDYRYTNSKSDYSKPDGHRAQFRIRDLPLLGQGGKDYIKGEIVSPAEMSALSGVDVAATNAGVVGYNSILKGDIQDGMDYDNIFIEDSFRTDKVDQFAVNLRRDFDDGMVNYVKAGVLVKSRERTRNRDRWSTSPRTFSDLCDTELCTQYASFGVLSDFSTETVNHPDFDYQMITVADMEKLIDATQVIARSLDTETIGIDSTKDDYKITEDASEAYLMAEFQLSDKSSLITGARYVTTDFTSTGYFSIRNDRFEDLADQKLDVAIPLADTKNSYSNWLPSIHYRFEPNDEVLVRASLWTSYTRPDFDQARAFANITDRVKLCNTSDVCSDDLLSLGATSTQDVESFYMTGSGTTLNIGNPNLVAMTATNFDSSIAWYPSDDLYLQAAFFYKDIKDFIVDVNGVTLALDQLPMDLPVEGITQFQVPGDLVFDSVNFATNGDNAKVYGVELSYSQNFTSGFFISSNLTLMSSTAHVGDTIRPEAIQLPNQADQTFNLTLGWENEDISLRLIGNTRSKILKQIGACPDASASSCKAWSDIYQDASSTLDFKATYQINDMFKIYFDALNLTAEKDLYYYQGNAASNGNVLFLSEDFGRSVEMGVNIKF